MVRFIFSVVLSFTIGGLIGYYVSSMAQPLIGQLEWLPGGSFTVGIVSGLVFALIAGGKEYRRLARERDLQQYAIRSSLQFSVTGSEHVTNQIKRLMLHRGSWWVRNEISGRVNDLRMTVGDLVHRSSGDDSRRTVHTIVHFSGADIFFPHFTLQREGTLLTFLGDLAGVDDIDFSSHPEFSRLYHLSSDQPETTKRLFNEECLKFFSATRDWHVRAERDQILVTRESVIGVKELDQFIDQAKTIAELFRRSVQQLLDSSTASGSVSPPALERQQAAPLPESVPTAPAPSRQKLDGTQPVHDQSLGWIAQRVQANRVSWDDVEQFVGLPAPRQIPALIQRQRVGCNGLFFIGFLCLIELIATVGLLVSVINIHRVPMSLLVVVGMVMIGVTVALVWLVSNRKRKVEILRDGQLTSAELVKVRNTGWEVNHQPQFEVEFRYHAAGLSRLKKLKVYGAHGELALQALESDGETPLLVDPRDPDHCVLGIQLTNSFRVRL